MTHKVLFPEPPNGRQVQRALAGADCTIKSMDAIPALLVPMICLAGGAEPHNLRFLPAKVGVRPGLCFFGRSDGGALSEERFNEWRKSDGVFFARAIRAV
jgi:hypothetical protein